MAGVASPPKCFHCSDLFRPDPRNRGRQSFCGKPDCRKASKRHSQSKWLNQRTNADYFKGSANVERVRQWRARNPGYWKRSGKPRPLRVQVSPASQMPEHPVPQPLEPELAPVALQDPFPAPLQDPSLPYPPVIVGLVALHLGSALQEDIGPQLDLLAQHGLAILRHGAGGRLAVP